MSVKGFVFFYDWEKPFELLSGEEFKEMFLAMLRYQRDSITPPEFDGTSAVVASFIFPQLDRRRQKADAGKKGGERRWEKENAEKEPPCAENCAENSAKAVFFDENSANGKTVPLRQDKDKDKDKDYDKDSDKDSDKDKDSACEGNVGQQVMSLPFENGDYAIANAAMKKYAEKYTAIDVKKQLTRMAEWLRENPRPRSDAPKFINGWLFSENANANADAAPKKAKKCAGETESSHDAEEFFRIAVRHSTDACGQGITDCSRSFET